jgi:hypothetical protein
MKVAIICYNCKRVIRRSHAYRIRVLGGKRNEASMLERPDWQDVEEKGWLCRLCGEQAGYKVKENRDRGTSTSQVPTAL